VTLAGTIQRERPHPAIRAGGRSGACRESSIIEEAGSPGGPVTGHLFVTVAISFNSLKKGQTTMLRDIDYAATAVQRAIIEKFGRSHDVQELRVTANENTISLADAERIGEGTRDALLAAVRKAESYDHLWQIVPGSRRPQTHT
jgi:hypothetical protein